MKKKKPSSSKKPHKKRKADIVNLKIENCKKKKGRMLDLIPSNIKKVNSIIQMKLPKFTQTTILY